MTAAVEVEVAAKPGVVLRAEWPEHGLLFDAETGREVGVDAVGAWVWRLLDGTRDLEALVAGVRAEFADVPDTARADVAAFVAGLAARGLAGRSAAGAAARPAVAPDPPPRRPAADLMATPRTVTVEITARCNLRCRYCYYFDNPAVAYRDLATAEWVRFFDELGRAGVMHVLLAGGEPFARPDLPELVGAIVRNRMRFAILSNGALVDDAGAAAVARSGRCDYVQISVDGADAATHDAARGPGAFAGALRGLRRLQRAGVTVTARVTIHRHNVTHLEAITRLLLDDLGVAEVGTNAAGYLGSCQRRADEVLLDAAQRGAAMRALLALSERYPGRVTAAAGPLAEARAWREMERARACGAADLPGGGRLTGCGCPASEIAVRADGVLVPCPLLAHVELGHLGRDRLVDVWHESPALARLRARRALPLAGFEHCAGCAYTAYCTGNCPGSAYGLTGMIDHPSPDACLRDYLAAGGSLP
jgi:SynChlorMet cassette radical SAM/SPASM protein ScmE